MKRLAVTIGLLAAALSWPAGAHADLATHGYDGTALDLGSEVQLRSAGSQPRSWCGEPRPTDDLDHELRNGDHKFHAIYAVPRDATDRFRSIASRLQTDAFQASALLERQYGRAIRFDMGTSCGAQYLDITAVRLRRTTAELAQAARNNQLLQMVRDDLAALGFVIAPDRDTYDAMRSRSRNYFAWLDGPPVQGVCGVATHYVDARRSLENINAFGGKLAVILRRADGSFCGSNTVRHEIGHALGALMPTAANAFDGAHCNDAYEDTMCYSSAPKRDTGEYAARFFDYGNNDYWDPPGGSLGHWTVNLSPYICADVDCNIQGGAGRGGFLDQDDDGITDLLDSCRSTPGTTCEATDDRVRTDVRRPYTYRAKRVRRGRWAVRVNILEDKAARVAVTCRGRVVKRRTVYGPRKATITTKCSTKPVLRARM